MEADLISGLFLNAFFVFVTLGLSSAYYTHRLKLAEGSFKELSKKSEGIEAECKRWKLFTSRCLKMLRYPKVKIDEKDVERYLRDFETSGFRRSHELRYERSPLDRRYEVPITKKSEDDTEPTSECHHAETSSNDYSPPSTSE